VFGCYEEGRLVELGHFDLDLSVGIAVQRISKTESLNDISSADLVVVFLVSEPEGQDTLFLWKG